MSDAATASQESRSRLHKYPLIRKILLFFPVELLLFQIRSNLLSTISWLILTLFVTGHMGKTFGIQYLFLEPEYLSDVNYVSFYILGLALGGFIIGYNISGFITHSRNFPFLATLSKPFLKYCLNNFIIPTTFITIYIYEYTVFHWSIHYRFDWDYYYKLLGLIAGLFSFITLALTYFFTFSKDIQKLFGLQTDDVDKRKRKIRKKISPVKFHLSKDLPLYKISSASNRDIWEVETYLTAPFVIRAARSVSHYDQSMLNKVLSSNHFHAFMFVVFSIITLLTLGIFREISWLMMPAGASILILFTVFIMLAGALNFVFRKWTTVVTIILIVIYNALSLKELITSRNYVYGLDYDKQPVLYNPDAMADSLIGDSIYDADILYHKQMLGNWKKKFKNGLTPEGKKPKIIFINCSGGGSRAAMWTLVALQTADSLLQGRLMQHTYLITGSSGGMIGSSYFREMYRKKLDIEYTGLYHDSLAADMGEDLLNPIATSIALNDYFIRTRHFTYAGHTYPQDRGTAFEERLNKITHGYLDKTFASYREEEFNARIPMMIMTPTLISDGRRLLISNHPMSFISYKALNNQTYKPWIEDIEFSRVFKDYGADNLKMLTAIRMNATFPYILPPVSLPTIPVTSVMDAGIRDNYGIRTSVKYAYHLRDWILTNTDGVIFLEISDSPRINQELQQDKRPINSALEGLALPLGALFWNITINQVYNNEQDMKYVSSLLNGKLYHIKFDLTDFKDDAVSLSLHLTEKEKSKVRNSVYLSSNKQAILELYQLLALNLYSGKYIHPYLIELQNLRNGRIRKNSN
jgi:hypothetical protein